MLRPVQRVDSSSYMPSLRYLGVLMYLFIPLHVPCANLFQDDTIIGPNTNPTVCVFG